ncbi:MAG TPA: hypothetical protein VMF91_11330 [Bryobacteraceae bacterium]|nr:hypothetical protein [Bryobacteraceae bacterium]
MASRFLRSCSPGKGNRPALRLPAGVPAPALALLGCLALAPCATSQFLIKPSEPGEQVRIMPSDLTILESGEERKDLPCTVTQHKPELGFDLRFHGGYEVTMPLRELAGTGEILTILFRVEPQDDPAHAAYFVQHYRVPPIDDDAKGDALLQGAVDLGEGTYHVQWLMRDRQERICASDWDLEAVLPPKDKPMPLFIGPRQVAETLAEPFVNDGSRPASEPVDSLALKLLVNFAPQNALSSALQRSDTDALVSILKAIQRDPHVGRVSLVAFNIEEGRVIYRQEAAEQIDFPALGKALKTMKLGTVNIASLGERHSQTQFLQDLIEKEVGTTTHPDAVIFAGPKAMLDADVPQDDLRRIGDIECPVFYMNYNLNPQAVPWKDSISHAIRAFKGTEYTISRPRDLWLSTTEMVNRILRDKRQHALATASAGGVQ